MILIGKIMQEYNCLFEVIQIYLRCKSYIQISVSYDVFVKIVMCHVHMCEIVNLPREIEN